MKDITPLAALSVSATTATTAQASTARVPGCPCRPGAHRRWAPRARSHRPGDAGQLRTSAGAHPGIRARAQVRGCADAHLLAARELFDVAGLGGEGRS